MSKLPSIRLSPVQVSSGFLAAKIIGFAAVPFAMKTLVLQEIDLLQIGLSFPINRGARLLIEVLANVDFPTPRAFNGLRIPATGRA